MEPSMAETKENESDNNLKNSSKSSLKGFEHQQANGSIAIKDKDDQPGNTSDGPQGTDIYSDSVSKGLDHKDPSSPANAKKRSSKRKKKNDSPTKLSDSDSSFTSLTSSSDESEGVVVRESLETSAKNVANGDMSRLRSIEASTDGNLEDVLRVSEIGHLKQKLQEAQRHRKASEEETKTIQKQKDELEERLSSANKENEELTAKAEKLKGIKEELTDKNEELKNTSSVLEERDNTIQSLRTEITNMQENRETMQKELQDTREELSNSVSVHKDSGIYTEELQETIKELKSKAENREQDICDLKDQLEMAKKEVEGKGQEGNEKETQLREQLVNANSKAEDQEREIVELKDQLEMAKKEIEDKGKEFSEVEQFKEDLVNARSKAENQDQEIGELKDQLEMAKKEIESKGKDGTEVETQLREELMNAKSTIRSVNQGNSKLEAKLSNSQTIIETGEVERQKLKEEAKSLKDKIKWLERRRTSEKESTPKTSPRYEATAKEELERKLQQESQRRTLERIRELEQKVIQVNDEKLKLKQDYDEAVKALEAVDKVYSVRELALQQCTNDLEDANNSIKQQSSEILQMKMEVEQLKKYCEKAEKKKDEQEEMKDELKDELTRIKETVSIYKTEIEEVRKEVRDQIHELHMAQVKARERGKKIQILDLELSEMKETLQISRNVIDEKQKNMESLQESLQTEKKNCTKLEEDLEEMFYLKTKLVLIEDEKARIVEKLRGTEADLRETKEGLKNANQKNKEFHKELESLRKDHKNLFDKCEDQEYQIQTLREVIENKEGDIEQQLIEIIHSRQQLDDVTLQLQDIWATYHADKELWKHRGKPTRRSRSAAIKRISKAPTYQSPPPAKTHSLCHRRLVNKLGEPVINQNYINSTHKELVPTSETQPATQEAQAEVDGPSSPDKSQHNGPPSTESKGGTAPKLSPRPPNGTKPHPVSSYSVHTNPPVSRERMRAMNGYTGGTKIEDIWMYKDGGSSNSGDSDEQIVQLLVNTGDRVLIQSKVVGDELLNLSGIVKFVGKVGKKTNSPVYVGLKLDQPFGDNNGIMGGKEIFKCQPRHGKLIKMSDVQAVMHPRTQNYQRVKSLTANW